MAGKKWPKRILINGKWRVVDAYSYAYTSEKKTKYGKGLKRIAIFKK
jgi:hypothetical protein